MAYFSNGTEGAILDVQCMKCRLADEACPIAIVQMDYNYDQIELEDKGFPQLRKAMNELIDKKGICKMYELIN